MWATHFLEVEAYSKDFAIHHNNILFRKISFLFLLHILKEVDHLFVVHAKGKRRVILDNHKEGKIDEGLDMDDWESSDLCSLDFKIIFHSKFSCNKNRKNCISHYMLKFSILQIVHLKSFLHREGKFLQYLLQQMVCRF